MTELDEQIHMSLKEDLLAHLGKEILVLGAGVALEQDPSVTTANLGPLFVDLDLGGEAEDDEEVPGLSGDTCVVISLLDEKARAISLEKLIRSRGLHVSRRRSDYLGTTIQTIPLLGAYQISYAIADEMLLLAYGKAGVENLRAVLDMSASKKSGKDAPAFSRLVRERMSLVGERWQDLSSTSIVPLLSGPEFRGNRKLVNLVIDLLKKHNLHVMVAATDYEGAKARTTAVW